MTQRERHVVSAPKVFVDQRLEFDVGQNIAAVGQEWFVTKMTFGVFDPAAGFEQIRLVNKHRGKAGVLARGKEGLKQIRMPVRVNDESVHSHPYQMIERESDERFLKNRNERLRKFVG
jgi:hypothetical protein